MLASKTSSRPPADPKAAPRVGMAQGTLLGLLAILLWSATVALARSLSERIGPATAGTSVYLAATAFLGAHLLLRARALEKLCALPRRYLIGCGALFALYTVTLFLGLGRAADRGQAIEVGLMNYLWPALTLLFSLVILGRRATIGLIPGTVFALAGVFLALTQDASVSWESFARNLLSNPAAYGLGLLAAVTWALYSNLTRRWGPSEGAGAVPLFTLATGLAFMLLRLLRPERGAWSLQAAVEVGFLSLATALAYLFWDVAMREGDLVLVAACSYLTPLLSTLVSAAYLRAWPGITLWLGCLLIMAGSFLSWRSIRPSAGGTAERVSRLDRERTV